MIVIIIIKQQANFYHSFIKKINTFIYIGCIFST